MKRTLICLCLACVGGWVYAQDIYKVENFSSEDLSGTARYVGMGGAMGSLGADLSVMGSNPAGIGLYRKSDVSVSASMLGQKGDFSNTKADKLKASFDQIGFVFSTPLKSDNVRFLNFGFNYQKRKNFKNFARLDNIALDGLSQSMEAANLGQMYGVDSYRGDYVPIADAAYNSYMFDPVYDASGHVVDWNPSHADSYNYNRTWWGGLQQYDINVSMNVKDRMYFGMTFGFYNAKWNSSVAYDEQIIDEANNRTLPYYMDNAESITGTGFDVKFGAIFRPIEESPFRFGISLATPTFYDLSASSSVVMNSPYQNVDAGGAVISERTEAGYNVGYDFRIRTPWKLGVSLATTVGTQLALGAEYEAKFMHSAYVGYPNDYRYSWGFSSTTSDPALNNELDIYTGTVHTFKVGAELQMAKGLFLRAGYNYVSSPFKKDAFLNYYPEEGTSLPESATAYNAVGTDYMNIGGLSRVTGGLGYHGKHFYADAAVQYQMQKADVYPFQVPIDDTHYRTNAVSPKSVDLNNYRVVFTLGYKF
ncbi:MAG: hypothetical protein IJ553_04665 [Alloprevotella sp.]|nr:hypothetical protein [Alloprevotella sp.]